MRKLFQVWLGLTLISMVFYLPFYVFSNNALDAVEEVTPDDLIPLTGTRLEDPKRKHNLLVATGIDTSMTLEDALEDNKSLSNVSIQYAKGAEVQQAEMASGFKIVEATADIGNDRQMQIMFTVMPKRFLKSNAMVNGFLGIKITDGKHSFDMIDGVDDELYLWALFDKSGKHAPESIKRMSRQFDVLVGRTLEHEQARARDLNPPAVMSQPAQSQSAVEYFEDPLSNTGAGSPATTQASPAAEAGSRTRAGNPGTGKIIIFQFEGQPAYCADEGEDGVNCRGDSSAFIGSGSYQDFMDPGSAICIAGEPDCKLPDYFPADVRG